MWKIKSESIKKLRYMMEYEKKILKRRNKDLKICKTVDIWKKSTSRLVHRKFSVSNLCYSSRS